MTKVVIRPMTGDDIDLFVPFNHPQENRRLELLEQSMGHNYTAEADGKPIAVMGLARIAPWAGEFWLEAWDHSYPDLWRQIKAKLHEVARECKLKRLQATTGINEREYHWEKWLGFHPEGILQAGLDGKDCIMWVHRGVV